MLRRNSFRLPRHPASVGLARRRAREHLVDWGHKEGSAALEDIVLVVSELASNVVRHGPLLEREFEVAVTALADGSCLVEVSDEGTAVPRIREVGDWEETGRGLRLVEHLAAAWGVWSRGRHGKTVWALVGG
ncbi:ATP-binding protein [Streptomyces sp. DSM 3412]|uniref:ATP-binding protein n=1 Tax=Streptomyces gottesmaniae TaxID=3075518 RepID=A0ABU2Z414_9ACTN|nr:ATP-binding protein [Streptomyces sp. DSM 3412]MDT0570404.1 ATP-binding protein [Streptomyces sp. DSM 3412]